MNISEIYTITLGKYSDKYLVTGKWYGGDIELRRVRMPQTKIDAVRLPERISIRYFGTPATDKKRKK